ncbi:MAG: UMP kinase [Spirochaetes bacterium]|nr:UMP kinase [Spirochaetota bacterium]
MTYVLSLGGSIVAPAEGPDVPFLVELRSRLESWLAAEPSRRLILVVGGGGPCRIYQNALKEFAKRRNSSAPSDASLDLIGIAATRINAQFVAAVFAGLCADPVVEDPTGPIAFTGQVLVASGWKPGFSSDYDAVALSERFNASTVLNLSNIAKVYTADPKLVPDAKPLDAITWPEFRAMVGSVWTPGANLPFDPIASAKAQAAGLKVVCAAGRDLDNLIAILEGRTYVGTRIG